jgi:YYY domain-containing protein
LAVPYDFVISPETAFSSSFAPREDGELNQIAFKYVLAPLQVTLSSGAENPTVLSHGNQLVDFVAMQLGETRQVTLSFPMEMLSDPSAQYQFQIALPAGSGRMQLVSADLSSSQTPDLPPQPLLAGPADLQMGETFTLNFPVPQGSVPDTLKLQFSALDKISLAAVNLHLTLTDAGSGNMLADQSVRLQTTTNKGVNGNEQIIELPTNIQVQKDQGLILQLAMESQGVVSLVGTAVANESSWDDGQPLRIDGYDGFGGIYQGDLNFELYWDEDANKVTRFMDVLDRTEYIFITSSRQWGSLPRIPERFPLTVTYYRALIGCPEDKTVESCFINAQVSNVHNDYGFELVQVFENAPQLGLLKINDQGAEEAYTVYDHPKVLIFHKTADYDSAKWAELFGQIDLAQVVHLTPKQASGRIPPNLILPPERLEQQRAGGTWSELFDTSNWINSSPWVSAVVWYAALMILGIAVYPLVRWLLPGLRDGGYPFARLAGLVLLAWFAWMGGSLGLTFSRGWLATFAMFLVVAGAVAAWVQRKDLRAEWKTKRAQFLRVELLFLAFFLLMLFIRVANPDLWHPAKGGEKPMDFSYFNAVLKSTTFPPYDPWFSGGYINYYYYGFVLVGSLVKLLGIVPAVAYNLILPSLFAMLALGAYSVAWNLWGAWSSREGKGSRVSPEIVGIAAAVAMLILGNMGSISMIFEGWARLGAEGAYVAGSGFLTELVWTLRGIVMSLTGQPMPYGLGDWYWNPTRIIPAPNESAPITEFPLFTFVYADLHAHMIALPVTVLGLGWALSTVMSRAWNGLKNKWQLIASLIFGAIIIGSLRPINTWDFPTYLLIGMIAAGYAIWRYVLRRSWTWVLGVPVVLAALSVLVYKPFTDWYRQGYASIRLWDGAQTPSGPYLTHWAIFLFFIIVWMIWETRQWMASTPLSSVRKLENYTFLIYAGVLLFIAAAAALFMMGVAITWLVLPLLVWVGLLFFRPGQDEAKRLVLFMIGTGLFLTLFVEVIVLQGDISRMNTVFKFYMQAWVLLAFGAAFALGWTLDALRDWSTPWRGIWQFGSSFFLICGMLFMAFGVTGKMRDRMSESAPFTLDGMAYMQNAITFDQEQRIEMKYDYEAIRWMQENVQGSPVIVEAQIPEYRWGTRMTIYTGLPTVLGWNWHQRQQREFVPGNDIWGRAGEIQAFYTGTDITLAQDFLAKYQVHYIVVGQLEQAYYFGSGLDKFEANDGTLWNEVYRNEGAVIYEVADSLLAVNQ